VPDFPKPGILFRDISPLLADPRGIPSVVDGFLEGFMEVAGRPQVDAVVAIESRGFIFGGALAMRLGCGFVPVRKPGKLPAKTDKVSYALEYGEGTLEMHLDALSEGTRVIIVDDLLATGGTAKAAMELCLHQKAEVLGFAFVIELAALGGRKHLQGPCVSLVEY
jgi:adenine phosphoribosyltransferase